MKWPMTVQARKQFWDGWVRAVRGWQADFMAGWLGQKPNSNNWTGTSGSFIGPTNEQRGRSTTSTGQGVRGHLYRNMNIGLLVLIGILTDRAFLRPVPAPISFPFVTFSRHGSDPVWIAGHPQPGRYRLWQFDQGYFFKDICPIPGETKGEPDWPVGATLLDLVTQDRGSCSNVMPPYAGYTKESDENGQPILRTTVPDGRPPAPRPASWKVESTTAQASSARARPETGRARRD